MPTQNDPLRRVILLRHGRTAWNAEHRWQGRIDVPLDEIGLRQVEAAASLLVRDGGITRLVSSPARRALQTTSVVKGAFDLAGRPPVRAQDERLWEIDMGQWAGLHHGEVAERFPEQYAALEAGEDLRRGGDGETMGEAVARVRSGVDDVIASMAVGECALIVSHGAVIRGVASEIAGLEASAAKRSLGSVENCHWVELAEHPQRGWQIRRWNVGA